MAYTATKITGIGDPFVLLEGDTYYMYATYNNEGINVWCGKDLNALEFSGVCYRRGDSFGFECFWAPEVVKRADGKFVMHFTAKDRKDGILRTGVAVSDSPKGPFTDAVSGQAMFDIGTATIDASCFIDGNKAYLFYVKDCSTNVIDGVHTSQIYVAELTDDLLKLKGQPVMVATPTQPWETNILPACCMGAMEETLKSGKKESFLWNEGPAVLKHNGKYYLTYSANCYDSKYYSVGVAVADNPMGPYVKLEQNPVMQYIEGELSGPGHNMFFKDKSGNLICAFHCHTYYEKPSGDRRFCYAPVVFENGILKILYK